MSAVEKIEGGPPSGPPGDRLWRVPDVAEYLQMSVSWVRHAAADGRLPVLRIGGAVRFEPEQIRAWARGDQGGKVIKLRAQE